MYQEQRLEKILELLEEQETTIGQRNGRLLQGLKDTIRRDFALLSQRQLVRRDTRWSPSLKQRTWPFLSRPQSKGQQGKRLPWLKRPCN